MLVATSLHRFSLDKARAHANEDVQLDEVELAVATDLVPPEGFEPPRAV